MWTAGLHWSSQLDIMSEGHGGWVVLFFGCFFAVVAVCVICNSCCASAPSYNYVPVWSLLCSLLARLRILCLLCVCRHMLSTLCSLCKSRKLAPQVRLFIWTFPDFHWQKEKSPWRNKFMWILIYGWSYLHASGLWLCKLEGQSHRCTAITVKNMGFMPFCGN